MVHTHGILPFITGFTIPLSVLRMSVCVSLLSPSWLRRPVLWRPISVLAPILGGIRQKPYLLQGRAGHVC